jgi:RHS repeat-associated protein
MLPAARVDEGALKFLVNGADVMRPGVISYDDWGQVSLFSGSGSPIPVSAIGNTFLFQALRFEPEIGHYRLGARTFDPRVGRFAQRRPGGAWFDAADLGNACVFAGNNPLSALGYAMMQEGPKPPPPQEEPPKTPPKEPETPPKKPDCGPFGDGVRCIGGMLKRLGPWAPEPRPFCHDTDLKGAHGYLSKCVTDEGLLGGGADKANENAEAGLLTKLIETCRTTCEEQRCAEKSKPKCAFKGFQAKFQEPTTVPCELGRAKGVRFAAWAKDVKCFCACE